MKLPIKKKYFDKIKSGEKSFDFRDAHITFVCEETGERIIKKVIDVKIIDFHNDLPDELKKEGLFDDDKIIQFELDDYEE